MIELSPDVREALDGVHGCSAMASAWRAGDLTVPDLPCVSLEVRSTLDKQLVRTEATLVVDDDDGRLVPYRGDDPLAPYGQLLTMGLSIEVGDWAESVPLTPMVILAASPSGSWASWQGRMEPTGGTVELSLADTLQDIIECELPGLMQPKVGASAASEITRLCDGVCEVDTSGLPAGMQTAKRGTVYDSSRMEAIMAMLTGTTAVMRTAPDGGVEFFTLPAVVSKQVTIDSGQWVAALPTLDRDGIWNTVIATSDVGESRIQGVAQELTGAFSATGPLHQRIFRSSSPAYTSNAKARAGAATKLAQLLQERSIPVRASIPFDPGVECGDLHRVSLVPGSLEPTARVTAVTYTVGSASIEVTYQIPRQEVEAWNRPVELQPTSQG